MQNGEAARRASAAMFLGQLLSGIQHTGGRDDLTFAVESLTTEESAVHATVVMPSGDKFRVEVTWLSEQSP